MLYSDWLEKVPLNPDPLNGGSTYGKTNTTTRTAVKNRPQSLTESEIGEEQADLLDI